MFISITIYEREKPFGVNTDVVKHL